MIGRQLCDLVDYPVAADAILTGCRNSLTYPNTQQTKSLRGFLEAAYKSLKISKLGHNRISANTPILFRPGEINIFFTVVIGLKLKGYFARILIQ